jgi:hypothetical protein
MNTQSKAVNLLKRVKTADGWYFFAVARVAPVGGSGFAYRTALDGPQGH